MSTHQLSKIFVELGSQSKVATHRLYHMTSIRNVLLGAGFAYCIEKEKYYQLPIVFFFPSAYAGYHAYKNREYILEKVKEMR
jgi:hypothetical protein